MKIETVAQALQAALQIPVYPAPIQKFETCAVYQVIPAENDGMQDVVHIRVCIFAPSLVQAYDLTNQVTAALVHEGENAEEYYCTRIEQGSKCGKTKGYGWHYVITVFACIGRGR